LDGTKNVKGDENRLEAGTNDFGGSYLIFQKWEHNLKKLNKETIKKQEDWVGRSKGWSEEIPKEKMPSTSHVSRFHLIN
jgi:porphyrinogen peroxidase